jgi:hypothetical protein
MHDSWRRFLNFSLDWNETCLVNILLMILFCSIYILLSQNSVKTSMEQCQLMLEDYELILPGYQKLSWSKVVMDFKLSEEAI